MKLVLLLLCPLLAQAGDWTEADTVRQTTLTAAMYLDYAQSKDIKNYPDVCWEQNPLLGRHPSDSKLKNYFIGAAITHYTIARTLPAGWKRQSWQYGWLALEVAQVVRNKKVGFKFQF